MGTVEVWNGDAFGGCTSFGGFGFGSGSPGPGLSFAGGGGSPNVSGNKDPSADPKKERNDCNSRAEGHSIDLAHQVETLAITLFKLPGEAGLSYSLYYVSPRGWSDNLDYWLDTQCGYVPVTGAAASTNGIIPPIDPPFDPPDPPPCTQVTLHRPDGSSVVFNGSPGTVGSYSNQSGGVATLVMSANGIYTLYDEDASTLVFSSNGQIQSIKDVTGIGWAFTRSGGLGTNTTQVTHTSGKTFTVAKQSTTANGVVTAQITVTDPAGNAYHYTRQWAVPSLLMQNQPANFQLTNLSLPGLPATVVNFKYSSGLHIPSDPIVMTEVDYNGTPYFYISYDYNARPITARESLNNKQYSISYTTGPGGTLTAAVTNPLGHITTKNFQWIAGQYMLISVSDPATQTCGATSSSYAYDSNGHLVKTIDNNGVEHTYSYATNGQLQTETEAPGTALARTTNYVWDPAQQLNRLLSVTVPGLAKTAWSYTGQNRIASVTRTNLTAVGTANQSLTTNYGYTLYANGMVKTLTVTAPSAGGTSTYAFDAQGNLSSSTNGLGHVTSYSGYNGLGLPGAITGPNGDRTDLVYDARGRVSSRTTHPNGGSATWTYEYDGFGLLSKLTAPDGRVTTWLRDAAMRLTKITRNDKDGASTETFTYNADNGITSQVLTRSGNIGKAAYYVYDNIGRVFQAKGSNGQVLTYAYDGNGNTLSVTDALGHKTIYAYDALNRATSVTNAASGVTSLAYDKGDNVVKVTDPRGLVTTYAYDGLGNLWNQTSPDTGTTTFTYDSYGRPVSRTRADGVVSSYSYDALNRLTSMTADGQSRTYTWDACSNGKGRLCTASTSAASVNYSYTPEGWIAARGLSITSGPVNVVGYGYNAVGQVSQILYPDGSQALYDCTDGVVSAVRLKIGSSTINAVTNIVYRPGDLAMSGWTSYNGVANTIGYDSDLRPTSITAAGVQNLVFAYDTADRIIKITNGVHGNDTQNLGYDVLDRLTSVSSSAHTASYSYDGDGNRTYQVVNGVPTSVAYAATSNRLNSAVGGINATYDYNAYGSTTTVNGLTTYTYDPFGRLINAGGAAFLISAEDQRLRKMFGGDITYFIPDTGGALLADNQNGTWRDYVWLNGRMVAMMTGGGVYSLHGDQTGRTLAITGPTSSAIIWEAQGLPFDRNTIAGSGSFFQLGFPGQYWDVEDSLWHNGYRDCDATTGRYIQSDPIGLASGVNTYAYAGSNPVSNVDPSGLILGFNTGGCLAD